MGADTPRQATTALMLLLLTYGLASLFHYAHNAEFLADYPNMPGWLSRTKVYFAWLGVTAVGMTGYLLFRRGHKLIGLSVIALYAALGFDGLAHYSLAPMSAHTATMNVSIWLEVAAAALLLIVVAALMTKQVAAKASAGKHDA